MTHRKENYADLDKFKATLKRQRRRYYQKTAIYPPKEWTKEHDKMVLAHAMSDNELSKIIEHSVWAIQKRRSKLKKKEV